MYDAIHPGQVWLDADGNRIEAHGGALWAADDGTYFWYGENKDHTDGKNGVWTWGVKYYASRDLMNWEYRGFLLEAAPDEPGSALDPARRLDRPHIVRNAAGDYVMWVKYSGEDACFAIFRAAAFEGPYELVCDHVRPFGKKVGDFDLFMTEGGIYLVFDADHEGLVGCWLTADALDVAGAPALVTPKLNPPYTREAPAIFSRGGRFYLLTSGMTGYLPNPSRVDVATDVAGPYAELGNPHVGETVSSFDSQVSQVFHVPGTELWIALADRWVPDYPVTPEVYGAIERAVGAHYDPERFQPTTEDIQLLRASPMLATADTSKSTYVWLPVTFDESGTPHINWLPTWRP